MSVNWETFKNQLGFGQNASVVYIDDEGSEIPIDSDWEFQEALRLAKMDKKRLKLILYYDKLQKLLKQSASVKYKGPVAGCDSSNFPKNLNDEVFSNSAESNLRDNTRRYRADIPPPWFMQYMKRFKKELLHELKSDIIDIVENVIAKNKAVSNSKLDFADELFYMDHSGHPSFPPPPFSPPLSPLPFSPPSSPPPRLSQPFCSTAAQNKKKRKVSEKDLLDLTKQREVKIPKRLEKLREKSERLEKLCNKTRVVLEEKKRLLEKIIYFKMKLEKMGMTESDKKSVRKSGSFLEHEVFLYLMPGGEFTLNLNIINDGKIAWSAPRLECYEFTGLQIQESSISLPKLLPMDSCVATLRGKADKTAGLLHFKCILVDGVEKIGSEFTCWARVDFLEPNEKYCKVLVNTSKSEDIAKSEESVDVLFDLKKDVIANSKKKIEENIIEIEKRLQDLDLIQSSPDEEINLKNEVEEFTGMKVKKTEELKSGNCDLLQGSEDKETNWKEKLEQEEVVFGVDCLGLAPESSDVCSVKMSEINDEENEKIKKNGESESSCDSELSVISMSEDETFFVVPSPSKSPSPAQSVHEDQKSLNEDSVIKLEPTVICVEPDMISINNRIINPNADTTNDLCSSPLSPTRMRRSSLGEISESKPKKMKSESTEYRFTTANLTQPTFTAIPEGYSGKKPSKFTFTGEKKGKPHFKATSAIKVAVMAEKEEDRKYRHIRKTDALGRVIYAVNINGYCLPVRDLFKNEERCRNPKEEKPEKREPENKNRSKKRSDRVTEVPVVNIPPLINGVSNVASFAFNTAKSVINNLQSAFVPEVKTESGKPASENKKRVSMEAMFKLYEMGFSNVRLNQKLLLAYNNDLTKVIEVLVKIKQNSSDQPQ